MTASIRRYLREPLLHFVVAGLVLFVAGELHRQHVDASRIVLTSQREAHLKLRHALQFGSQPDEATLARLVERDIQEEMLFRRGLALGLDQDDEIVRRRIVQKMEFLLQDLSAPGEPSDAELAGYHRQNVDRYSEPARVTFSHIYFAPERDDRSARSRAENALRGLMEGRAQASELGDPFPDRYHFAAYEPEQVYRLFGRTELSAATLSAPLERWAGPFRSSYGWHLLRVDARVAPRNPDFTAVRDAVRTDYLLDAQAQTNAAALAELARKFMVVREQS
jgi:peptidyl-prolyl cis-trans isomerase C